MERLLDVLVTGPLQVKVSTYQTGFLKVFMLLTGIMTIVFNGHNFLYFNGLVKNPLPFTHPVNGKYQIHRIWNLAVMYPLFVLAYQANIAEPFKFLFLMNIVIGFYYNLVNLIQIDF